MGILDNFEAYLEKAEKQETDLCHHCQSKATYTDIAQIDTNEYTIIDVCECHAFKGLNS
jgi:hypothetical protein